MEWTRQHDVVFCREILATDPFQAKRKTTHRAKLWEKVAENLEKNDHIKFKVSVRSVRDRYSRISQKSKKKARDELKSTGTSPEMTIRHTDGGINREGRYVRGKKAKRRGRQQ